MEQYNKCLYLFITNRLICKRMDDKKNLINLLNNTVIEFDLVEKKKESH